MENQPDSSNLALSAPVLANVGPGPDQVTLSDLLADQSFLVILFQRDHFCTNCRKQVQRVATRFEEFVDRDAMVVSILPEPRDRAVEWRQQYEIPYPFLADPEATVGDEFEQPVRFGILGSVSDFFGRMPSVIIIDGRDDSPQIAWEYHGSSTFDRPTVDDILTALDELQAA